MLHAARLTSLKGQRDLIAAAARLDAQAKLDNAVFILAGDAPGRDAYREELIGLIERHGLAQRCGSSAIAARCRPPFSPPMSR